MAVLMLMLMLMTVALALALVGPLLGLGGLMTLADVGALATGLGPRAHALAPATATAASATTRASLAAWAFCLSLRCSRKALRAGLVLQRALTLGAGRMNLCWCRCRRLRVREFLATTAIPSTATIAAATGIAAATATALATLVVAPRAPVASAAAIAPLTPMAGCTAACGRGRRWRSGCRCGGRRAGSLGPGRFAITAKPTAYTTPESAALSLLRRRAATDRSHAR